MCRKISIFRVSHASSVYVVSRMKMKHCLLFLSVPFLASAEIQNEIPLGIEAVTGYRTEYVHRGFKLADDVFDFQLQTEIVLSDHWSVNIGGWYATATSNSSDFSEIAGFVDLRYDQRDYSAGIAVGFRDFTDTLFRDAIEVGPYYSWHVNDDVAVTFALTYDSGADAWYGKTEVSWSKVMSDKSFISALAGISMVDQYYDRDGFNDIFGRVSYTYKVAQNVSLSPFIGTSLGLDEPDESRLFGGVWFEVTF